MNNYGSSAGQPKQALGNCNNLKSTGQAVKNNSQEEDAAEYSTIDGGVINWSTGTDAVKKGTGLFIGDYFVGMPDSLSGIGTTPYLRY